MAGKPVEIHPAALAEFKSALGWYFERSGAAALKLVEELDRAIQMVVESPARWPKGVTQPENLSCGAFLLQLFIGRNRQ